MWQATGSTNCTDRPLHVSHTLKTELPARSLFEVCLFACVFTSNLNNLIHLQNYLAQLAADLCCNCNCLAIVKMLSSSVRKAAIWASLIRCACWTSLPAGPKQTSFCRPAMMLAALLH